MATKPLDRLSPAYRRRIERAEARGFNRQAARGHKPREHIERRRREIAKRGITNAQASAITRFHNNPAFTQKRDVSLDKLKDFAKREGYENFREYRRLWERANQSYKRNGYKKGSIIPEYFDLQEFLSDFDKDEIPDSMYYYH